MCCWKLLLLRCKCNWKRWRNSDYEEYLSVSIFRHMSHLAVRNDVEARLREKILAHYNDNITASAPS
jgi:hypothetical protein